MRKSCQVFGTDISFLKPRALIYFTCITLLGLHFVFIFPTKETFATKHFAVSQNFDETPSNSARETRPSALKIEMVSDLTKYFMQSSCKQLPKAFPNYTFKFIKFVQKEEKKSLYIFEVNKKLLVQVEDYLWITAYAGSANKKIWSSWGCENRIKIEQIIKID